MTTEPEVLHFPNPAKEPEPTVELTTAELSALELQRLKDEVCALKKDKAVSVELAEESESARRDWDDLKGRTKEAKDRYDIALEALSKQVRGEVQTELEQTDDQDEIEFDAGSAAPMNTNLDAIEVAGLDWGAVEQAALSTLVSTGKPARVKPVEILGLNYVLVDVQDRVAVFHQAMDAEQFLDAHEVFIGVLPPLPNDRCVALEELGQYAGIPIKVGRKMHWLAAAPLLVRIPPAAAISATPPADETDCTVIGNRIVAHLTSSGVEHMAVDALAKLLGVERDIVQRTASQDARLAYEIDGERVGLA